MKLLVSVWHPAHVHFFKNIVSGLKEEHDVRLLARDKEISIQLLEEMNIDYHLVGKHSKKGLARKFLNLIEIIKEMLNFVNGFRPDMVIGFNDMYSGILGKLIRRKSIIFGDDDIWTINTIMFYFLSDVMVTPNNYRLRFKSEHYTFKGFKELSYLHPNNYKKRDKVQVSNKVLFRFVGLKAAHDIGVQGLESKKVLEYIKKYERYSKIIVSSEENHKYFPEHMMIKQSPGGIHDLLSEVDLLITDSQTMTTEAAVLGTPVIRTNSLRLSNFVVLERKYGLVYNIPETYRALDFGILLLDRIEKVKAVHLKRRDKMLDDMVDVSQFSIDFINNYGS